jgi:hypothetical protein
MSLPMQVQSRLYHFKTQMLGLVAAHVFSVVMVSRLFGISRNTFYKYCHQAEQGSLASFDCTPHVHGSAKPQPIVDAVLRAKAQYPSFGKQRLANLLYHQGVLISPNTEQRILRKEAPSVPPVPCPRHRWNAFEALAPHVIWAMEMCQTQPIKMSWCPLSLLRQMPSHLRGGIKREHEMDVHRLSCDDNFADQASGDGLPFYTRELFQIVPQQLAKGCRIVDHLLPVDALLPRLRSLPTFLLDLLPRGREFLPPRVECTQGNNLGLIGIQQALVLPFEPLPSLQQLRVLRLKPGEVLLFGFRPRLMQVRNHMWIPQ